MEEITRNDFSYFQNEILKDMKSMECKLNQRLDTILKHFQNTVLILEEKYDTLKTKTDDISKTFEIDNIMENINNKLNKFSSKIEETTIINNTKILSLQKELSNACFKYDKIFLSNISSPGLIGDGCSYPTMRAFLEYINGKVKDLSSSKEKFFIDFRKYEDSVKIILDKFKDDIEQNKNEINNLLNKEIKQYDERSKEKMNIVEDKLSFIKIENGRYNYNLNKKWEELQETLKLFNAMNDNLIYIYNNCRKEYLQIKTKFNDLSKYFKEMKYTKNTNLKSIFDDLSKKININNKQLINFDTSKLNNMLPSITSIDDISKIDININKQDNIPQKINNEKKLKHSLLLKKKTFQIDSFGSSFNLKNSFTNSNYTPMAKTSNVNVNILNENNNSPKKVKKNFDRKLTQNINLTKFNITKDNNICLSEENKAIIIKENRATNTDKDNNNIIEEEEKKENFSGENYNINNNNNKNKESPKKESPKKEKEKQKEEDHNHNQSNRNNNNNNNDEKIKDEELYSNISEKDIA